MQIIHDLGKAFLSLIHALHIREVDAVGGFNIDLGIAFSHIEGHGTRTAACLIHHFSGQEAAEHRKEHDGQHPGKKNTQQPIRFFYKLA